MAPPIETTACNSALSLAYPMKVHSSSNVIPTQENCRSRTYLFS